MRCGCLSRVYWPRPAWGGSSSSRCVARSAATDLAALDWARAPPAAPLGSGPGSAAAPPLGAAAQGSSATPYGKGHWVPPPLPPVSEPAGLCSRRPHCVLPPPSRQVSGVKLRELLVWQLITGYKLRELEAKEELNQLL